VVSERRRNAAQRSTAQQSEGNILGGRRVLVAFFFSTLFGSWLSIESVCGRSACVLGDMVAGYMCFVGGRGGGAEDMDTHLRRSRTAAVFRGYAPCSSGYSALDSWCFQLGVHYHLGATPPFLCYVYLFLSLYGFVFLLNNTLTLPRPLPIHIIKSKETSRLSKHLTYIIELSLGPLATPKMASSQAQTTPTPSVPTTNIYEQVDKYPWNTDEEFQGGLSAILGNSPSPSQTAELTLRARCFYYSR